MIPYKKEQETAIAYARVSTRGQERLSIPTQLESCGAYAKENGYQLNKTFQEARSGYKEGARKDFYDMLEYIRQEKPCHLVYMLSDRLSRNLEDFLLLVKFCRDIKLNLILHDVYKKRKLGILDPEAFEDFATTQKDIIDNRLYSERLRRRVNHSIKDKLERGEFPGYAPVGYKNEIGRSRIIVDAERLPLVVQAFNLFATGEYSLDDITKMIQDKGLTVRTPKTADRDTLPCRPIGRGEMYRVLKSRFYIGEFNWSGKLWSNKRPDETPSYEIQVSKETFDEVQAVFKRNQGRRMIRKGRPFLYRGLLTCRYCGCQLVGEAQGKDNKYIYYRCSYGKKFSDPDYYLRKFGTKVCPNRWWKEAEITAGLLKSMSLIEHDDAAFQALRKQIGEEVIDRHEAARNELTVLRKGRTELQDKLDRLLLRMTEDHSKELLQDFKRMWDKLKQGLAELEAQIRELEGQDASFVESGIETLETAQEFVNIFKIKDLSSGTLETDKELPSKKILLKAVIRTIICGDPLDQQVEKYVVSPDALEVVYNEPFNYLLEVPMTEEEHEANRQWYEEEGRFIFHKKEKWRGRRDSNSRPPA